MKKEYFVLGNSKKSVFGKNKVNNEYKMEVIDLKNNNDSHSIIVNHLLKNKEKNLEVLDVGCNTGVIGQTLIPKGFIFDGIEYDRVFYKKLKEKKIYRNIYNISVCDFENDFFHNKQKYDYIIFADVLEHLQNPDQVLLRMTKMLKEGGKFIISIPNIAHLDIIIQLINGNFNYNDEGILDSTHLRFFTDSSFKDMIDNIEHDNNIFYEIKKIGDTRVLPPYANAIDTSLFNMYDNLYDYSIVQNIYELSITNKKQKRSIKNVDSYKKMNDNYNNILDSKFNTEKTCLRLQAENEELNNRLIKQTEELNRIKGTLRYKLFFRIIEKFRK